MGTKKLIQEIKIRIVIWNRLVDGKANRISRYHKEEDNRYAHRLSSSDLECRSQVQAMRHVN